MIGESYAAAPADVERLGGLLRQQGFAVAWDGTGVATGRGDLGLTSLEVITFVVAYMGSVGASVGDFDPEWVGALESTGGIIWVLKQVDERVAV